MKYYFPFFLLFVYCTACVPSGEFTVKPKKRKKAGRKSKERLCKQFADCVHSTARIMEKEAKLQQKLFGGIECYVNGDDHLPSKKDEIAKQELLLQELQEIQRLYEQKLDEVLFAT